MSLKLKDQSLKQVEKIVLEYGMKPAFVGQSPYIASGLTHEILAGIQSNGLFQIELLDKQETEKVLQQTILIINQYTKAAKS